MLHSVGQKIPVEKAKVILKTPALHKELQPFIESQIKSLEECWLKMNDLTAPLGEENTGNDLDLEMETVFMSRPEEPRGN